MRTKHIKLELPSSTLQGWEGVLSYLALEGSHLLTRLADYGHEANN